MTTVTLNAKLARTYANATAAAFAGETKAITDATVKAGHTLMAKLQAAAAKLPQGLTAKDYAKAIQPEVRRALEAEASAGRIAESTVGKNASMLKVATLGLTNGVTPNDKMGFKAYVELARNALENHSCWGEGKPGRKVGSPSHNRRAPVKANAPEASGGETPVKGNRAQVERENRENAAKVLARGDHQLAGVMLIIFDKHLKAFREWSAQVTKAD